MGLLTFFSFVGLHLSQAKANAHQLNGLDYMPSSPHL